jgi:hypothetical protein
MTRRGRHEPLVITIRTPQGTVTLGSAHDAAQLLRSALADAEAYRRGRADSRRGDRTNDLALAHAYQGLAAEIASVLPEPAGGGGPS